ncbi:PREDICTED: uncharacterized protein LOC106750145 isoform X2 [Dinoponera quadriceps]|uniref:Uncharacterized protein LOC106750145 isoform X2 n=1 Tax=Dinoponera quadriceps TaxID=609295 RepID=A0A6P3Y6R5_DINQU|nr:PREDICTED: uncharacterized protein LOC106750145 isoform X2 [Dinoponera quadriceps]
MSDLDEETDTSCEEEQVPEWEFGREWFEGILSEYFAEPVRVTKFELEPETMSEGALCSITKIDGKFYFRKCQSRSEIHVIIKELPKDPFSRFFVTEGLFDFREINFYSKIPRYYHSQYIPAGGTDDNPVPSKSMLLLQDVRDSTECLDNKFSEGLTLSQTKAALETIANFHGITLAMKVVKKLSMFEEYPFLFETAKAADSYQQLFERGLPLLARFLKCRPGLHPILKTLLSLRPRTKDIISSLLAPEGPIAVITHTDFWCNNLVFNDRYHYSERQLSCYAINWQMVTYSRPTNDVALLILSSVSSTLRRKNINRLLDAYWAKLTFSSGYLGVNIEKDLGYTREDFNKDYRRSQLLALLLCIGSVDIALGNPKTEQRLIDVLEDLYKDGVLTDEAILARNEPDDP